MLFFVFRVLSSWHHYRVYSKFRSISKGSASEKKTSITPSNPRFANKEIKSLTSKGSTFRYILASDIPLGDLFNKRKWETEVAVFVGSVEGLFPFHWYGDCGGVSVCLSASARKSKWHFSIASTQCRNIVPVYKWSQRHFLCSMLSCIHSSTDLCDHISIAKYTVPFR